MELTIAQALKKAVEEHQAGQLEEADRLYTAILKAQPKHPDASHNLGVLAVSVGKLQQALPLLKTALDANPTIAQFWISYIDTLIKLGNSLEAITVLEEAKTKGHRGDGFDELEERLKQFSHQLPCTNTTAIEPLRERPNILDSLNVDQALYRARKKAKDGLLSEAELIYQDIVSKFPKNKRAIAGLKSLASKKSESRTNVKDPSQDQLQSLISIYNRGELEQALKQSELLVTKFPKSAILFNIQGAILKSLGQQSLSVGAYHKAIAIKPDFADPYYNLGISLTEEGKLEEAIELYRKALAIKPNYASAYNNMGIIFTGQGKFEEAMEAYNKALAIKPDYASAYNNMGITLKKQSKLEEAIWAYNKALEIKPDYADAYNNMGITFKEQQKLEEAMEAYNKALTIKPDYSDVHNNIGNALSDQGKQREAIEAYTMALEIKPDYADAYYNMGNALKEQGKPEEAIRAYNKALAIKPEYASACNNMGIILNEQGKHEEAIQAYSKAIALDRDYLDAYQNIGFALQSVNFQQPNPGLIEIITAILDKKVLIRPKDIVSSAIKLLKLEPSLIQHLHTCSAVEAEPNAIEIISDLSKLPLLLKLMSVCPLSDLEMEKLLSKVRAYILSNISDFTGSAEEIKFQSALALQCFTNEYLYSQSDDEEDALTALEAVVKQTLNDGAQPSSKSVLCLASFKPLAQYEWSSSLLVTSEIEEVFKRQVLEPQEETKLKAAIPVLSDITNEVSSKVRDQYEVSPYPRWVNLGLRLKPAPISKLVEEIKLKLIDDGIKAVDAPEILVAGCGTGQHSIGTAARFQGAKVMAIDLSLSSLSYAKRKTDELEIQNIEYLQADILDLDQLGKQFDIVESAGVLHHMDDPFTGWRVLTDCLKPGGLMKIGLYSEVARQCIVEMRKEISMLCLGSSDTEMKSFRHHVINSDQDHHSQIQNVSDFYSLSELKDLLFHVQEHRFTIPQIQDCLVKLGLQFCGFEGDRLVSNFKLVNTNKEAPYNLAAWQEYEVSNPSAFLGMYQFWCQKIA